MPVESVKTVGVIGAGRFGKLLAEGLAEDFDVVAHDSRAEALCGLAAHPRLRAASLPEAARADAVFLSVPIVAFEAAAAAVAPLARAGATVLDVCSAKLHPESVMRRLFSPDVRIVPTHPMFGPDSAKHGWLGLPIALCPISGRGGAGEPNAADAAALRFWREYFAERKGCRAVEMTSEEHDRVTAYNLCLTQLLGRVLGNIGVKPSPIDAQSFKYLLQMKEISYNDSLELLTGLHRYNPFAAEMRARLRAEFAALEPLFAP